MKSSCHFYTGASHANCTSGRSLHNLLYPPLHWMHACTVFLCAEPDRIKEFLKSYFSQWNWGFPHPNGAAQLYPHWYLHQLITVAIFWSSRKVPFGPVRLQGFRVLVYMRTDQSGTRGRDFFLYKSAPFWLWECTLPFHWRLCCLGWAKTQKMFLQCTVEQTSTDQSRPMGSTAELFS